MTERFLRGGMEAMKLLKQYEAACKVRGLASRTIPTYWRWVAEFLRFHHDRTGRWIHLQEVGEREVEAFLTHLAVNRRVAESTQNHHEEPRGRS
jgi:site-specific recombinase XerD